MHLAPQHLRMWHCCVIRRWRMIHCLVNRVLHTDCVIQASLASDTHAVTAAISHTPSPSLPETLIYVCSKKNERCTNPILHRVHLGQRVKREHKQERTSARAAKRNEYVTHGADTCAVGGLGGLSVMVGLREEQHNVVSVEWITTATRERAGCFLCEHHPTLSHLDLYASTAQPVCCPFQSSGLLSVG